MAPPARPGYAWKRPISRRSAVLETQEITIDEVLRAGRVLYGPAFAAEAGAWRATLKATYRRRAMETHPDRARSLGRAERDLAREFKAVAEAYRVLSRVGAWPLPRRPVVAAPSPPPRAHAAEPRARPYRAPAPTPAPPRPPADPIRAARVARAAHAAYAAAPRVRVGVRPEDLPQRRLRLAEYLYYAGRVGWSDLVEAIAWQRAQRPPVGRIAVDFGFLAAEEVTAILERRRIAGATGTPFGQWAVREGSLTPFQILAVLGRQLRMQRPIGQWFVERGLVGADEVDAVRNRILRHNARFVDEP